MTSTSKFLAALCLSTMISGVALADTTSTPATTVAVGSHTLTVTVSGIRSARGTIRAQLVKADLASGTAKGAGASIVAAVEGSTSLSFANLTDGEYAVQMFHDEDGDGQMKTNLFGIPSEGYAFSNAARAGFGPPKFSDMKVIVRANAVTIANMAY
jgi:uncharacterized protein (DUF2141 family)